MRTEKRRRPPSEPRYVAILGDLRGSRDRGDRAELQRRLKTLLRGMKTRQPLRKARAAGPEITSGDEFQVLLHANRESGSGEAVIAYVREITEDLGGGVTFGLGLGSLSTPLGEPVRELDGPCFHHARRALERAKHEDRWAAVSGAPAPLQPAMNSLLRLTGSLRASWTPRQGEIIRELRTTPLQKDVARSLGVTPPVISAALKSARFDAIREAEEAVELLLNRSMERESVDPGEGAGA
jgi:hypothetical protein